MQQIQEQSYEQSSEHSLQVIHIESIKLHSSDQSLSPQNSSIITTKNKQIKKCLIKGLDFSITSSQFIQEEYDKKQILQTKQYDHEILPMAIAPKLGKQMNSNNQIDINPIKADTFHIASFVQQTQSITAMQNKSSNESLNKESEQKNQNIKKNSKQYSRSAKKTSYSDNSQASASNLSFTLNLSRNKLNRTLNQIRTKSKRDNLNQTHASRIIISVPKNHRENKQNKNQQISSQSSQLSKLLSYFWQLYQELNQLENPDQKQASRDKNQIKNSILVLKNKVIELIKQQEPKKLNFLLTIYKNESAINLRVQKDIFLPLEIQLDQIGSFKQEFHYSLNLSYKSFNIVQLTSFMWKNLVKLILKTTSLCDDDWIVIVRQSNNFPSLNNFIQNVEYDELVELKKGMPYLKEINFIHNWIKAQNRWINRFSYIQNINILLLSNIIMQSLQSRPGDPLIKPINLSYLRHMQSLIESNDSQKMNLQNISPYSFKILNNSDLSVSELSMLQLRIKQRKYLEWENSRIFEQSNRSSILQEPSIIYNSQISMTSQISILISMTSQISILIFMTSCRQQEIKFIQSKIDKQDESFMIKFILNGEQISLINYRQDLSEYQEQNYLYQLYYELFPKQFGRLTVDYALQWLEAHLSSSLSLSLQIIRNKQKIKNKKKQQKFQNNSENIRQENKMIDYL